MRYYGSNGKAHTGWLVTDTYKDYGLQRYWFGSDGVLAVSRLVSKSEAGWWAYATKRGYVVRGRYKTGKLVYLADNDGRLEDAGWTVSDSYGQGLQRYWVDSAKHAAVAGFSKDGWAHYTTSKGYVLRGGSSNDGTMRYADNDGRLMKKGWLVTDAFGQGLQRYWMSSYKAFTGGFFKSNDGIWAYAREQGYVLRGKMRVGDGMLLADNDGVLVENIAKEGWLVTGKYDGELQRYRIDDSCNGHLGAHLGYFTIGKNDYYGRYDKGYVVRGYYSGRGTTVVADNDGCILGRLNGIDIHPEYQSGVDFDSIDANFVIIKATQGTANTKYWKNLQKKARQMADKALNAGKMIGFYHFVDTSVSAESQAKHFYKAVKNYIGKAVLALDWENNDVSGYNNIDKGPSYAKRFLDELYRLSGVKAVIYMNRSTVQSYDWSSVSNSGYGLWLAQYLYKYYDPENGTQGFVSDPTIASGSMGSWDTPTIYQYTSTGVLDGYNGQLDFDVFYGNANQWSKLAARS